MEANTNCTLTYNKGQLGTEVFNFPNEQEAYNFLHKENPPDLFVRSIYLDVDGLRHLTPNPFFWPAAYDYAVEDRKWREGYFRRTGRLWDGGGGSGNKSSPPPEDEDLDNDACLRLLDLKPGFTQPELAKAYREAIKMNHPDKVAALAEEFRVMAEQRTRLINYAYSKLLGRKE